MKFVNHLNEVVEFGKDGVFANHGDLRDYKWTYNALNKKIASFKRDIGTRTLPIIIGGDNAEAKADKIFEVFEKDVIYNKAGKMWIGDYYLEGFFYASKKTAYENGIVKLDVSFVTDRNFWACDKNYLFRLNNSAITEEGLGYPYDYPYDFLSPISIQNFNNTSFAESNFIMTIYGFVENPMVTIGGNSYKVNCTVESNEYLTINSRERTIIRTTARGEKVNEFAQRDKEVGNVFQLIPSGVNKVTMASDFNLDITILEERSEPLWT